MQSEATHKKFLLVQKEGNRSVKREVSHYNLDMIIALGYRVQSQVAARFRRWATERLHEYIQKGFAMDDERLKQGGSRYFREKIAKNYLSEIELQRLNLLVSQFLDFAEFQALEQNPMTMNDWIEALNNQILALKRKVLAGGAQYHINRQSQKLKKSLKFIVPGK